VGTVRNAALASESPDAHPRTCGGAPDPPHLEGPTRKLAALEFALDEEDACDLLAELKAEDSAGRLASATTGEWMYVFMPRVAGETFYVKLILRNECVVVSFHEDEGGGHEEDA
jgi:hypothetical protein